MPCLLLFQTARPHTGRFFFAFSLTLDFILKERIIKLLGP